MTKVLFLPEVADQFLELAEVLYQKGYLGLKEVAVKVKKDAPPSCGRFRLILQILQKRSIIYCNS